MNCVARRKVRRRPDLEYPGIMFEEESRLSLSSGAWRFRPSSIVFIGFDIPSEPNIVALAARFILRRVIHFDLGKVERQMFHTVAAPQSGGGNRGDDDVFHLY